MATRIQYGRPSDNVAPNASAIVGSAEDATYPASFLADLKPAKPAKLTTTTGYWQFTFSAPQRIDAVALIHHNLDAGLEVRIKASADAFATTALDTTITIPAAREDGFTVSPFTSITGVSGYSAGGYATWRIQIVGTNSAAVAIGEVVLLSVVRELEVNVSWGATDDEDHPLVEHRTDFLSSMIYEFGIIDRSFSGTVDTTGAGAVSLRSLARDARGRGRAWLCVLEPDVNEAWFVRFVQGKQSKQLIFVNRNGLTFAVEEVARSLPL